MKFRLVEENELEKRAKYHKKRQKGLSPFYSPDGGNVPLSIDRFNNSVAEGANGLMESATTPGSDYYRGYEIKYNPDEEFYIKTDAEGVIKNDFITSDDARDYIDNVLIKSKEESVSNTGNDLPPSLMNKVGRSKFDIMKANKADYEWYSKKVPGFSGLERIVAENLILPWLKSNNWMGGLSDSQRQKIYDKIISKNSDFTYDRIMDEEDKQLSLWDRSYFSESLNESRFNPLKLLVLRIIDKLWDDGYDHPDNWISDGWQDLKDGIETGVDDLTEVAQNLRDYLVDVEDEELQEYRNDLIKYISQNESLNEAVDEYLTYEEAINYLENRGIDTDPTTYVGEYTCDLLDDIANDDDFYTIKGLDWIINRVRRDFDAALFEDTVKQNGKWVNKGDSGETHGTFKSKKEADAQRKAMFANGYKG